MRDRTTSTRTRDDRNNKMPPARIGAGRPHGPLAVANRRDPSRPVCLSLSRTAGEGWGARFARGHFDRAHGSDLHPTVSRSLRGFVPFLAGGSTRWKLAPAPTSLAQFARLRALPGRRVHPLETRPPLRPASRSLRGIPQPSRKWPI